MGVEKNPATGRPYSAKALEILEQRKSLPAWRERDNYCSLVRDNQVIVLVGETGSGKTTQCGQFLLDPAYGIVAEGSCVACTQPRRVAAMSVAQRVADEMDVQLGEEVGYTVRFDDKSSSRTRLKFLTDGMLLREAMFDPNLTKYSVILLDEAHERTLSTDLLFGLLKQVLVRRPDLKLVVMSATLDAERFQRYFSGAPLMTISGRTFPVEVYYSSHPESKYTVAAVKTALQIHAVEPAGDILIFLTGEDEIEEAKRELEEAAEMFDYSTNGPLLVVPLYSSLPPHLQQKIFMKAPTNPIPNGPPGRKIVISTNVAETSITIDGVVYVVDPGVSKQKLYNPRTRVESLLVSPISQASSKQRSGRAGRTRPGKCFRLYTEATFDKLENQTAPEMLRSNMNSVVLQMLKLGISNIVKFDFIDPPAPETMMRALDELNALGALDTEGGGASLALSPLGDQLADYPLDPQLSRMLAIGATKFDCVYEALCVASMISVAPPFLKPRPNDHNGRALQQAHANFANDLGDHLMLYNTMAAAMEFKDAPERQLKEFANQNYLNHRSLQSAFKVFDQLCQLIRRHTRKDVVPQDISKNKMISTNIRRAVAEGYFMQVAYHTGKGHYKTLKDGNVVMVHPASCLQGQPDFVLFHEIVLTSKLFLRNVSYVNPEWLIEASPYYYDLEDTDAFSPNDAATKALEKATQRVNSRK